MVRVFNQDLPAWIVVLVGALILGVVYTEWPAVGGPLLLLTVLLIVVSLAKQGRVGA